MVPPAACRRGAAVKVYRVWGNKPGQAGRSFAPNSVYVSPCTRSGHDQLRLSKWALGDGSRSWKFGLWRKFRTQIACGISTRNKISVIMLPICVICAFLARSSGDGFRLDRVRMTASCCYLMALMAGAGGCALPFEEDRQAGPPGDFLLLSVRVGRVGMGGVGRVQGVLGGAREGCRRRMRAER